MENGEREAAEIAETEILTSPPHPTSTCVRESVASLYGGSDFPSIAAYLWAGGGGGERRELTLLNRD